MCQTKKRDVSDNSILFNVQESDYFDASLWYWQPKFES